MIVGWPVEGFGDKRWIQIGEDAARLLHDHGAEAARLGWTTLDLFGAHPVAPAARYDCMGLALLLKGGTIDAIDDEGASIRSRTSSTLTFRRRRNPQGLPLWKIASTQEFRP